MKKLPFIAAAIALGAFIARGDGMAGMAEAAVIAVPFGCLVGRVVEAMRETESVPAGVVTGEGNIEIGNTNDLLD